MGCVPRKQPFVLAPPTCDYGPPYGVSGKHHVAVVQR